MVVTVGYLVVAWLVGPPAGDDPWRSLGFEWRSPSPPPEENYTHAMDWRVGAYDYDEEPPP
jgi:cytochrome c oxidase subunit 1